MVDRYRIRVAPHGEREIAYSLGQAPLAVRNAFRDLVQDSCSWNHPIRSYVGDIDAMPRIVDRVAASDSLVLDAGADVLSSLLARIDAIHTDARKTSAAINASALFPYQRDGVAWLAGRKAAGLFDEMGLGKTVQAIMAIPHWHDEPCAPTVIVCPASVKHVWRNEIKKWRPEIERVYTIAGRGNWIPPQPGEVVICNYEILPDKEDLDALRSEGVLVPGTILIADEIHATKAPNAKRTRHFRLLREIVLANAGACYGLTGTPLLNNGKELREVCKSIGVFEEAFGNDRFFESLFERDSPSFYGDAGKIDWFSPRPAIAQYLARVSLRRHRRDVMTQLPAKRHGDYIVADPPTGEAADLCDQALGDPLVRDALDGLGDATDRMAGIGMLAECRRLLAICKIPKLLETIETEYEENQEPVIVFSAHRTPIDVLAKRPGWITITGDTSQQRRAEIERDFQAGKYRGIAGTIRAMSEGLTLTHASHVLFVDLDWTPARNAQAEDRACRIGQANGVLIRHLVADHELDYMVTNLLVKKQRAFDRSVNMIPSIQREISRVDGNGSELLARALALQSVADRLSPHIVAHAS